MFWSSWTLRIGDGEMGGFVKDTLYLKRNSVEPGGGGDTMPPAAPMGLTAAVVTDTVELDNAKEVADVLAVVPVNDEFFILQ